MENQIDPAMATYIGSGHQLMNRYLDFQKVTQSLLGSKLGSVMGNFLYSNTQKNVMQNTYKDAKLAPQWRKNFIKHLNTNNESDKPQNHDNHLPWYIYLDELPNNYFNEQNSNKANSNLQSFLDEETIKRPITDQIFNIYGNNVNLKNFPPNDNTPIDLTPNETLIMWIMLMYLS